MKHKFELYIYIDGLNYKVVADDNSGPPPHFERCYRIETEGSTITALTAITKHRSEVATERMEVEKGFWLAVGDNWTEATPTSGSNRALLKAMRATLVAA